MIILAPTVALAMSAGENSAITATVFGMERTISGGAQAYKALYQGQLTTTPSTVYAPAAGKEGLIKSIMAVNLSVNPVALDVFRGGTGAGNRILPPVSLRPYGMATYTGESWSITGARGGVLTASPAVLEDANYSSQYAETLDRNFCTETNSAALVSGTLRMQAIWLTAGQIIRWISFHSATTAGATLTNQLFGLYDSSRNLLAVTANDTSTAWSANTIKTLRVTSPYTVPTTGLYYLAIMVTATTVPTLKGQAALTATQLANTALILNGTSNTGLTTSLPDPANALTVTTINIWGSCG